MNFQVSDLHTLYEQKNYEPHYKRALTTITELKTEVQAYRDLKDTLDKAAEVQVRYTSYFTPSFFNSQITTMTTVLILKVKRAHTNCSSKA